MVLTVGWLPYGLGMLVAKRYLGMSVCLARCCGDRLGLWLALRSTWATPTVSREKQRERPRNPSRPPRNHRPGGQSWSHTACLS
jgi:hypothetical protein